MKTLFGIEITDDYFDYLFDQQSKGKEIKVVNGKLEAVEHEVTDEERKQQRIYEIKARLNELNQDFIQMQCGAVFEDADARIAEFQALHNELRTLLGKEPREYK